MPGAFRLRSRSGPGRSGERWCRPLSFVVVGALFVTGSAGAPREPAAGSQEEAGDSEEDAGASPVCARVAVLDDVAHDLSYGDQTLYEGELGELVPATSPAGRMPVMDGRSARRPMRR